MCMVAAEAGRAVRGRAEACVKRSRHLLLQLDTDRMTTMPFGEYEGQKLDDVPADYLLDLEEDNDARLQEFPEVQAYIDVNRAALVQLSVEDDDV